MNIPQPEGPGFHRDPPSVNTMIFTQKNISNKRETKRYFLLVSLLYLIPLGYFFQSEELRSEIVYEGEAFFFDILPLDSVRHREDGDRSFFE